MTGIAHNIGTLNKSEDYGHDMAEDPEDEENPPAAVGAGDIDDEGQGVEDDNVVNLVIVDQDDDQVDDANVVNNLNHPLQVENVVNVEDFAGGEIDVLDQDDGAHGIIDNDDHIPVDQRCGVCWGDRNDPTLLLPCGHTFCGACVTVLMADVLPSCPQCRVVVVDSIRVFT